MFDALLHVIHKADVEQGNFKEAVQMVEKFIRERTAEEIREIVKDIGTIPESINHDSSEEKLYSKASDIVLSRCFQEIGLSSELLDERADSADIIAKSVSGYQYSLVADAKCFRLSRTAKNQKDFKVSNLSDWRGSEHEYAVLVAPYYQFPQRKSQIYSKALEHNVCLFSWEHLSMLMDNNIKETKDFTLESLWNASLMISRDKGSSASGTQECFLPKMNSFVAKKIGVDEDKFYEELKTFKDIINIRGGYEISYWENEIRQINTYSRERAIEELIAAKKLNEKINTISGYLKKLDV